MGIEMGEGGHVEPLVFRTGRVDCKATSEEAYKTDRQEVHADPQTNGPGTLKHFADNFKMNEREAIAIMGAHTMGRLHYTHTSMRYTWTARQEELFNNQYYRNMAGRRDWFFNAEDADCTHVGDAYGNPGEEVVG